MKKAILFFLSTLVACIALFSIYLSIGARVFGPKAEVNEACESMTVGMSLPEAIAIVDRQHGMDIFADEKDVLQISKVLGGWICVCKATLKANSSDNVYVTSVDEVFCSD